MFILFFLITSLSQAQDSSGNSSNRSNNPAAKSNFYFSQVDSEIQIQKILVLPFLDNASGIYSKPVTQVITEEIENDRRYDLVTQSSVSSPVNPDELAQNSRRTLDLMKATGADSILTGRILQGPQGIQGKLTLFHGREGRALLDADFSNFPLESMQGLENRFKELYRTMHRQLPFQGTILSRTGNDLTINVGAAHGAKVGDTASIIQFLSVQRHPKHDFMISSEREVLGKIRLTRVEPHLSFATVTQEREPLLLRPRHKVALDRFVSYSSPLPDTEAPYLGENPKEWTPQEPPQYARIQLLGGVGQYYQSATLRRAGAINTENLLAPQVFASGEVWLNQSFFVNAEVAQSIFTAKNPLPGSNPEMLNMSFSKYNLYGTYNLLLSPEFFGPRVQFHGGIHRFEARATHATPISLSSTIFGGVYFGLTGNIPVAEKFDVGLHFKYFLMPTANESVSETSGSPGKPTINIIGLNVVYRHQPRLNFVGRFDLDYYSVDFNRTGANRDDPLNNTNHRILSTLFGVEYLF